jgi:hypothetical protein
MLKPSRSDSTNAFPRSARARLVGAVVWFVLHGEAVKQLQNAWTTAKSILAGKILHIDLSGLTHADVTGLDLLSRMHESGARLAGAPYGPKAGSARICDVFPP